MCVRNVRATGQGVPTTASLLDEVRLELVARRAPRRGDERLFAGVVHPMDSDEPPARHRLEIRVRLGASPMDTNEPPIRDSL